MIKLAGAIMHMGSSI